MKISKIINNQALHKRIFPYGSTEFRSINPYNNKLIKEFDVYPEEKIEKILENSNKAYDTWRKKSLKERLEHMKKLADQFEKHKEELGKLITMESVNISLTLG